jgi:RNA polymerase sigma-70 factor (ECF subfamily)
MVVDAALAGLPANQRLVITLRDVQGFSAEETCDVLGVTEGNQRVLLHRARGKVRSALEEYVGSQAGVSA